MGRCMAAQSSRRATKLLERFEFDTEPSITSGRLPWWPCNELQPCCIRCQSTKGCLTGQRQTIARHDRAYGSTDQKEQNRKRSSRETFTHLEMDRIHYKFDRENF